MESQSSQKTDGRKRNGNRPGSNGGGGRKPLVAKLKKKWIDIARAEFWVALAQDKAIPALQECLESVDPQVRIRAAQEVLNRALGKPKESLKLDGSLEVIDMTQDQASRIITRIGRLNGKTES